MADNLKFYRVSEEYCQYLRQFDQKVPNIVYKSGNNKFFCGVVFSFENSNYFVPVSHQINVNKQTSYIVKDSSKKPIASLRFQFMLPCADNLIEELDVEAEENKNYQNLLRIELRNVNKNYKSILSFAERVYRNAIKIDSNIAKFCCNFPLLEQKCLEYEKSVLNIDKTTSVEKEEIIQGYKIKDSQFVSLSECRVALLVDPYNQTTPYGTAEIIEYNQTLYIDKRQFFKTEEEARGAYKQSIEDNKKFVEEELQKAEQGNEIEHPEEIQQQIAPVVNNLEHEDELEL